MAYTINHVHIRSQDPHKSAAWYTKHFGAKLVSERTVMPGTITLGMELEGSCRLNISSKQEGTPDTRPSAELNRLGLEHFGFHTEDITGDLARLEADGVAGSPARDRVHPRHPAGLHRRPRRRAH